MRALPFGLSICGKSELDGFAHMGVTHLLSLEDPHTPKETPPWFHGRHWQLLFHDVESPIEAQALNGTAVTIAQVAEILRCGRECLLASRTQRVHLLVHCLAGISRSCAAAYAIVAQAFGPNGTAEALEFVQRIRPEAFPNLLLVRYADQLLNRNGALVRALDSLRQRKASNDQIWLDLLRDQWSQAPDA